MMDEFTFLPGGSAVLYPETLVKFLQKLGDKVAAQALAHLWDGRVVRCELPEVTKRTDGWHVRVPSVMASLGGQFCEGKGEALDIPLTPSRESVFLCRNPALEPLNPDDPGLAWRNPRLYLSDAPPEGSMPCLEVARIRWTTTDGAKAELDESYFPPSITIGGDPRGMMTATRLYQLLLATTPTLDYLMARCGALPWAQFLPEVFHCLDEQWGYADQRVVLRKAAELTSDAAVAQSLVGLLTNSKQNRLPPVLRRGRDRLQLKEVLQPTSDTRRGNGPELMHRCIFAGPEQAGELALVLASDPPAQSCELRVTLAGEPERRTVVPGGSEPFMSGQVRAAQRIEVEATALLVAAGVYGP
jgi:hypothetical protein